MKVTWLNAATRSLRALHSHIAAENTRAASLVVQRIKSSVSRLEQFPASGRAGQIEGTLELVIPGLPYLVIYRLREDRVEILRVFHMARNWPELMS